MKVDIWIYTDDGGELHKESLDWSEACATICNAYILERLEKELTSDLMKDFIHDEVISAVIEKEKENENNKN